MSLLSPKTLLLLALGAALVPCAEAALGGVASELPGETSALRATRHIANRGGFDIHQLSLPTGTVVNEYVSSSGVVFAVSWRGPIKPDMSQLLGQHFATMVAAGQRPHPRGQGLSVRQSGVVIESGGKMRHFSGRAWLPDAMPSNLTAKDLQ